MPTAHHVTNADIERLQTHKPTRSAVIAGKKGVGAVSASISHAHFRRAPLATLPPQLASKRLRQIAPSGVGGLRHV
ncbi:uncharacterized protein N7459_004371 [Penicillium hispanicum]|uniref:uncharacterized protein n=1 Tax=Penicillium hispanicum TaxID=1080232 RepID=UPI00253F71E2|nr:uncharacterized protein N7459_004371 [Penicillium hispanicum]KAJ5584571.1 hypothetical protein N7459_004371 [Penicillium hispanicum]